MSGRMIISGHTVAGGGSTFLFTRLTREKPVTTTIFDSHEILVFNFKSFNNWHSEMVWGVHPIQAVFIEARVSG
jgi:hypothetical protein